jgi:hypothetical protein
MPPHPRVDPRPDWSFFSRHPLLEVMTLCTPTPQGRRARWVVRSFDSDGVATARRTWRWIHNSCFIDTGLQGIHAMCKWSGLTVEKFTAMCSGYEGVLINAYARMSPTLDFKIKRML